MNKPESEMVLVPRVPTQAMCQAGQDKAREWPRFPLRISPIYQAMLAASPQAVPSEQPIAEQPKPLESHLTSASGGDASKTALPEQPAEIETLDQFFAEAQRIGLTAGALAAALSKRPEFADCVPQTTFTLDDIGDALKGLSDDWQELIALRLAAKQRVEPGESA